MPITLRIGIKSVECQIDCESCQMHCDRTNNNSEIAWASVQNGEIYW